MTIVLRDATETDRDAIDALLQASFPSDAEARLVRVLRAQGYLSAAQVAEIEFEGKPQVVGYAALSAVKIGEAIAGESAASSNMKSRSEVSASFGLAPVAVAPDFQRRGIGRALCRQMIRVAREQAEAIGEPGFLVVLGDPAYYGPLGFEPAAEHRLTSTFITDPAHAGAFRALPICRVRDTAMPSGVVHFADAFGDLT